jgi:hypothetical protein
VQGQLAALQAEATAQHKAEQAALAACSIMESKSLGVVAKLDALLERRDSALQEAAGCRKEAERLSRPALVLDEAEMLAIFSEMDK